MTLGDFGGWMTLLVGIIALVGTYRHAQDTHYQQRVNLAYALSAEIKAVHKHIARDLEKALSSGAIKRKIDAGEPFVVWSARDVYPIYDNASSEIYSINRETIAAIVDFYSRSSDLYNMVHLLMHENFQNLSAENKDGYLRQLGEKLAAYETAKSTALDGLQDVLAIFRDQHPAPRLHVRGWLIGRR